jgi:serine/threonine protein kinase
MVGLNIGKYRVLERIGRGGMGTVYRAMDETLNREVAIKVLNAELNDPSVGRRFRAEAITVARLNHPGIATVFELFQHEGQWLMVMEFVRGETLENLVARKGMLTVEQAVELCMQALNALAHAHSLGVVHRDLKPANIMIAAAAGNVKIMDFGIARVAGSEHLTSAGFMMGTPDYMAPEQVLGHETDARADIYAMGVVLYFLTTARLPFKGKTPFEAAQARLQDPPLPIRAMREDLPPWISQVMDLALARAPEGRFQTAPIFREALRRGLANLPIDTPVTSAIPPELIATALPGSMRIAAPSSQTGQSTPLVSGAAPTPPPIAAVRAAVATARSGPGQPTAAAGAPGPSAAAATVGAAAMSTSVAVAAATGAAAQSAAGDAPPAFAPTIVGPLRGGTATTTAPPRESSARPRSSAPMAAIGVAVVIVALAGWWWMRSRATPTGASESVASLSPQPEASAAAGPLATLTTPPPLSPSTASTTGQSGGGVTAEPGAPSASAGPSAPGASAAAPGGSSTSFPPGTAGGADGIAVSPATVDGRAKGAAGSPATPLPGARGATVKGRGAAADAHMAFSDVRALIVAGKKASEQSAVLHFVDGRISLLADKSGGGLGSLLYRDILSALYIKAKNPKWDPKLAAPPTDVDMPGGLFRTAHHWLALQSRSSFLIVRLTDEDWQQVLQTVTARTSIKVERLAGGG